MDIRVKTRPSVLIACEASYQIIPWLRGINLCRKIDQSAVERFQSLLLGSANAGNTAVYGTSSLSGDRIRPLKNNLPIDIYMLQSLGFSMLMV